MKKIRVLSSALVALSVAGPTLLHAQDDRGRRSEPQSQHDPHAQQGRVSADEQQRRIHEEQERSNQYRQHIDQQTHIVREQAEQLQQARRTAQYRAQQDYAARIEQQQRQLRVDRNFANDPYITTPHNFRYRFGGVYHETNQFGADVLRQAVNNGYLEGVRAGRADRQDRWAASFQTSPAYRDANFGYAGNYVDRSDYNYYFRQGFQRGYEDGYNSRSQYGNFSNGSGSVLGNIMTGILGLEPIR